MPRKPPLHSLPDLPALYPAGRGLSAQVNQAQATVVFVRDLAQRVRQEHDTPFYPVRTVARFLNVPLRTAGLAYRRLQAEGLLVGIRGSHTLVRGRRPQPRHPSRGVVALPVWMPGLVAFADWRMLVYLVEEEITRHQYVPDVILYHGPDSLEPAFVDRVLRHRADAVLWLYPHPGQRQTLERLGDKGLPLLVLRDRLHHRFPGLNHDLDLCPGLNAALADWVAHGIRRVILPESYAGSAETHDRLWPLLEQHRLRGRVARAAQTDDLNTYLRRLTGRRAGDVGVIFDESGWQGELSTRAPAAMARLYQRHRCLSFGGLHLHPADCPGVRLDQVTFNWRTLARSLVPTIIKLHNGQSTRSGRTASFYRPAVPVEVLWRARLLDLAAYETLWTPHAQP